MFLLSLFKWSLRHNHLCLVFTPPVLRGSEAPEHRQRAPPHWRGLRQTTQPPRPGNVAPRCACHLSVRVCFGCLWSEFQSPKCASGLSDWDQSWAGLKSTSGQQPFLCWLDYSEWCKQDHVRNRSCACVSVYLFYIYTCADWVWLHHLKH